MTPSLVLAVVLGAGQVPISDGAMRFPNSTSWSGAGSSRVENMLEDVRNAQGSRTATSGPGPQQLAARWRLGQLNQAERVAVLLGAPVFHHPATLPIYAEALRSPVERERQAALVGLAWLLGVPPPDPARAESGSPVLVAAQRTADALVVLTRQRTLVELWADSYLVARGLLPADGRPVLSPDGATCLAAIREIAAPEDLDALVALWPMLENRDRVSVLKTLEIVTMQQFYRPPEDPQKPSGGWLYDEATTRMDAWVGGMCRSVDGFGLALANISRAWPLETPPERPTQPLLAALESPYEPMWYVPSQLLVAYGARSVAYDRSQPDNPRNRDLRNLVRDAFPLSKKPQRAEPSPEPRRGPRQPRRR